ncbi:4Fe-4S dicluster domain-containing protein [Candidatus Thorarchaeota archaeon]|nr:MAG: 4Fe-4S dicluster domain-containing protein [Candidatus Thorarchaeota archaeon]
MPSKDTTTEKNETTGNLVTVYIMGKPYEVPSELTIMKAQEYAGYRLIRGVGCRGGFCGACTTIYRKREDYKLYIDLACQTKVEDGMYLVQIPFVPAEKPQWNLEDLEANSDSIIHFFPEITRCVSCNACTQACPQNLSPMRAIQAIRRNDLKMAADLSFDCVSCGACSVRCPAEITHYHVFQLVRRLVGRYVQKRAEHTAERVKEIEAGEYDADMDILVGLPEEELKELFVRIREGNPLQLPEREVGKHD